MKLLQVCWLIILSLLTQYAQATENSSQLSLPALNISKIEQLELFKSEDHFASNGFLYTGVQDLKLRIQLNQHVANTAQDFIDLYKNSDIVAPNELLTILALGIQKINPDHLSTEDREQVATTFEQFLDIVEVESSGGILNTWLYGQEINDLIEQLRLTP